MELSKARFVKLDYQILTMDISPSAKIIYAYLANGARGSPDSTVSVTIKKITSDLKISRDLAMDSIRSLEENNLVSVTRSNGKRSIYQVQKAVGNSDRYQSEIATAPVGNTDRLIHYIKRILKEILKEMEITLFLLLLPAMTNGFSERR